jgi:signal transduction histidine kinase/ligand-binding sensor domain-containing protein
MYEDRYGFVWIGTQYGLNRYNGYSFDDMSEVFTDGTSTSVEWVWSIDEDREGTLWVCSSKGLFRFDRTTNSFEMFLPNIRNPESEDNTVYAFKQDSRGIYWLFTKGGLFSFNLQDHSFTDYKKDSIVSDENLVGWNPLYWWNQVRFYEDNEGTIWIGSLDGVKKYDKENNAFLTFRNDPENPASLSDDAVFGIIEDTYQNLWISTANGLNKMIDRNKDEFIRYYHDEQNEKSLVSNRVMVLLIDRNDNFWISGVNGFSKYNYYSDNFDNYIIPLYSIPRTNVNYNYLVTLTEDSEGIFWMIAWQRGIYSFNPRTEESKHFYYDPDKPDYLVNDIFNNTLFEDHTGSIWILSQDNLTRSTMVNKPFMTINPDMIDPQSRGDMDILDIYMDNSQTLWIAAYDKGIYRARQFDPAHPGTFEKISNEMSFCVYSDQHGKTWFHGLNGGLGKLIDEEKKVTKWYSHVPNNQQTPSDNWIGSILEDSRGLYWIGMLDNGINIFDPNNENFIYINHDQEDPSSLTGDRHSYLTEDSNGDMWFGTFNYGISYLKVTPGLNDSIHAVLSGELQPDKLTFRFNNFKNDPYDPHSLSSNQIMYIYSDQSGRLWIGTTNGLNLYNEKDNNFYVFKRQDGLPDNCIYGILEDEQGNLWLSNRKGICKVVLKDGINQDIIVSTHLYDKEDGLQGNSWYEGSCFKSEDGWMFFGGSSNGFSYFHPGTIKESELIPPLYITDIKINSESVFSGDYAIMDTGLFEAEAFEFSYKQNFLAFEYLALNYSNAEKNQYKYMMEGLDEDWVDAGDRRFAEYRDLKPGDYTFRVIGSNDDGVWNEEGASIGITIKTPWYRTILAYAFYIILLVVIVYIIVRWRTIRLRIENMKLDKMVKERTRTIEEQNEEIKATNAELEEQKEEIMVTNTQLEEQKEELEQQKEELAQQKEELQITLDHLKETQAQLIQSEKLAALGGLVAGVAHEINTPVGISLTAASSLEEDTEKMAGLYKEDKLSRADFKDYLNTANKSAKLILANMQRTATMVQSFKQVSADQSTAQQRKFFLRSYTEDVIRSLYPELKERKIHIDLVIDEKFELDSFPGAFSQIITNLVLNSLTHGFDEEERGNIEIKANLDKNKLILEYSDNGKGISPGHVDKIFEPFFTTNKQIGLGLGMHIVYNLVTQKLNGTIHCSSELDKGTSFRIEVPVA